MIRLGIGGVQGRMGQAICTSASTSNEVVVAGGAVRAAPEAASGELILVDEPEFLAAEIDVFIDVSGPGAVVRNLTAMRRARIPYVCGVTGLDDAHAAAFVEAAEMMPVLHAANFSVGVATVTQLLERAALLLAGADVEIVETHHRRKRDAPSGTALVFVEAIEGVRKQAGQRVHGREGLAPRQPGEIGIHSVRGGGNPGEHHVLFALEGEEVSIGHRALSRSTFADGAVRAAIWIANKPPGRYTMRDVIEGR